MEEQNKVQKRKDQHSIRWLLSELEPLEQESIIDSAHRSKLESYYSRLLTKSDPVKLAVTIIGILASLLIVGGVILLTAYNWSVFSRPVKSVFAILITLIPQTALLLLLLLKKDQFKGALKESLSAALSIAFGGSIAFIGQIYQLPENTMLFLSIWCVSSLVIAYLFESTASLVLYLVLVIVHTTVFQTDSRFGMGFLFIPLIALTIPYYIISLRKNSSNLMTFLHYLLALTLISGLGISFEKILPGTWIIGYSTLFVAFYLFSILHEDPQSPLIRAPFKTIGIAGMFIFSYILTFEGFWEDIGWDYIRSGKQFYIEAGIYDLLTVGFIIGLQIFFMVRIFFKRQPFNLIFSLYSIITLILFVLAGLKVNENILAWSMNAYILILCAYSMIYGIRSNSLLTINLSAVFLVITIVTRFFNDDTLFLIRGAVFILCGIGLLVMNLIISKLFKAKAGDANE